MRVSLAAASAYGLEGSGREGLVCLGGWSDRDEGPQETATADPEDRESAKRDESQGCGQEVPLRGKSGTQERAILCRPAAPQSRCNGSCTLAALATSCTVVGLRSPVW